MNGTGAGGETGGRTDGDKGGAALAARSVRLAGWMGTVLGAPPARLSLRRLAGGQSNPTWLVRADGRQFVLRQKPLGPVLPSAHAVDREYRVLAALAGSGVPVPAVHALCTDPEVMGSIFYLMDHVPGRVLFDPALPGMTRADRAAIYGSMNETAAAIHALDPAALGLADYGRPGGYVARQVARWTRQYRASETGPIPAMDALIDWLPDNLPPEGETRLVHGDFRLDNLILHPHEPRVVAVLDWELSTLGDPVADFAYHMMSWRIAPGLFRGLGGLDLAALGIPDEAAYLAAWCRRTGRDRPAEWEFHIILSLFRIAAIVQGIARRAVDGTANDPAAAEVGRKAAPLADLAWAMVRGAGR
jgi:aminoglycoside phosphotransferase (APT) family kinase protein